MEAQARQVGTRMVEDVITSIDTSKRPFHLKGDTGAIIMLTLLLSPRSSS